MSDPIRLIAPDASRPFLNEDAGLTDESRPWTQGVTDFQQITGNGSPEGIEEADEGRLYRDRTNTGAGADLWLKRLDSINNDDSLGWVLISGLSGNGAKTVIAPEDVTVVPGNKIINCTESIAVTLIDILDATDEITITATNGLVGLIADAVIQFGNTVASLSSITLYPANGQWWQKN